MILLITGAPGTGKSTVAAILHERLGCPWFEFGWIPEFRRLNPHTEISYEEEERLSLENLTLVAKNYLRHGFETVILTDIRAEFTDRVLADFAEEGAAAVVLTARSDETIRSRILSRDNGNEYRDTEEAVRINRDFLARPAGKAEIKIPVDDLSPEEVAEEVLGFLNSMQKEAAV